MRKLKYLALAAVMLTSGALLTACGGNGDEFNTSREISVIRREAGSGTHGAFIELLGIEVGGVDTTAATADVSQGTGQVITTVAGNLYAIGYISLGSLNDTVTAISIDGVAATAANVLNNTYPLFRSFEIVPAVNMPELAQDFINFILSAEGQAVVDERNYVIAVTNAPAYVRTEGLSGTITVSGSISVAPLMERLQSAYEYINPGVRIEIQQPGSGAGITAAMNDTAHIGMTSRPLRVNEASVVRSIDIAHDGLAVIVHNDSPLTNLTQEQVRQIFTGELTRWNEVIAE